MLQRRVVELVGAAAREHDRIDTPGAEQDCLLVPEAFPDYAFDAIALNRAAYMFLGNDKPEPWVIETIDTGKNQ